jgi:hypothetical protein
MLALTFGRIKELRKALKQTQIPPKSIPAWSFASYTLGKRDSPSGAPRDDYAR